MRIPVLWAERHIDRQSEIHHLAQTIIAAIGLRLEGGELRLHMGIHILQQQVGDVREAQHTGKGIQVATEEDQGPPRGHIRLEETRAPDHPSLDRVGTLDLPCLERGRHILSREKRRRTADRGHPLSEKGYFHQAERDTKDASFRLTGTRELGSQTRTTTVMPNALLLPYDVLSMPLASPLQYLLVALPLIFIQKG